MKNIKSYIFFLVEFIIAFVFLFCYNKLNEKKIEGLKKNNSYYESLYNVCDYDNELIFLSENYNISDTCLFLLNNQNNIKFKKIIAKKGNNVLVLYFSYLDCKSCVDFVLNKIVKNIDSIGSDNFFVIADFNG